MDMQRRRQQGEGAWPHTRKIAFSAAVARVFLNVSLAMCPLKTLFGAVDMVWLINAKFMWITVSDEHRENCSIYCDKRRRIWRCKDVVVNTVEENS